MQSDIFNQGKLLLNGLPLNLMFQRQKNNFALLSDAENRTFKVSFQDLIFCLRKVRLSPHKFQSIQQTLEKTSALYPINCVSLIPNQLRQPYTQSTAPALYPINCVKIKIHSVAQRLSSPNWENAILGQIQNRVFVAMTENAAFTGSYTKNPFLFKHNHLNSAAAYAKSTLM